MNLLIVLLFSISNPAYAEISGQNNPALGSGTIGYARLAKGVDPESDEKARARFLMKFCIS